MMGQQETRMTVVAPEEKGGGTLRRMIFVLAVAAMMAVSAGSASAGFAKGQDNSNPGFKQNNDKGDLKNEVCEPHCNPEKGRNGFGAQNN